MLLEAGIVAALCTAGAGYAGKRARKAHGEMVKLKAEGVAAALQSLPPAPHPDDGLMALLRDVPGTIFDRSETG